MIRLFPNVSFIHFAMITFRSHSVCASAAHKSPPPCSKAGTRGHRTEPIERDE